MGILNCHSMVCVQVKLDTLHLPEFVCICMNVQYLYLQTSIGWLASLQVCGNTAWMKLCVRVCVCGRCMAEHHRLQVCESLLDPSAATDCRDHM